MVFNVQAKFGAWPIFAEFAGPLPGYGILLRIGQISGNALLIEQGALYPGLYRLVRQGLLKTSWGTSENNRRAKYYELTAAGRKLSLPIISFRLNSLT